MSGNIYTCAHSFYTCPNYKLVSHLLKNDNIFFTHQYSSALMLFGS